MKNLRRIKVITIRDTPRNKAIRQIFRSGNHKRESIRRGNKKTKPAAKESRHRTKQEKNNSNKKLICNTVIKSIITCSCEMRSIKETTWQMLDLWWRAMGRSRLESNKRANREIKNGQRTKNGHAQRMPETRIPQRVTNWKPRGRRQFGRPRSWHQNIVKMTQKRNLRNMWRDRQERRVGIGKRVMLQIDYIIIEANKEVRNMRENAKFVRVIRDI